MQKVTCKQLGGPCNHEFSSITREEILVEFTEHIMQMEDSEHKKISNELKEMSTDEVVNWKEIVIEKWNSLQNE